MEEFNGVLFYSLRFWETLAVIEVNEVGCSIVLSSLSVFGTVSGEVSYFSALEAGIQGVSGGGRVALEVILWAVSLVPVRVLLSSEVIPLVIPLVVSLGWGPVPVYIHGNWGIVHPTGSVRRIILRGVLSLGTRAVPLGTRLLRDEASEVPISSEYISE